MDVILIIALLIIIVALVAVTVIFWGRRAGAVSDDAIDASVALMDFANGTLSLPIERISALSVIAEKSMVEITDSTVLARISQSIPAVVNTVAKTVTETAVKNAEIYKIIIPKGETLVKSKDIPGAFRGFFRDAKSIKGQANLVKVDLTKINKATKLANSVTNIINVGSLVVGQYYMAEISSKLETMNDSINKISDFQDREFKSRIISLMALVGEISQFSAEIMENDELRTIKLSSLENMKADATELLGQVNETIIGISQSNPKPDYKVYQDKVEDFYILVEYQNILIVALEEISKLSYLLGKGYISSEMCYSLYNKFWKISVQTRKVLEDWHDSHVNTLKIDLSMNRRSKSGIEGFFSQIPAFVDDKWKYKELKHGLVQKITTQTQTKPQVMIEQKAIYDDDVQIIIKDGKYYYLPDSISSDSV